MLDVVTAVSFISEVEEGIFSEQVDEISTLKAEILLKISKLHFMFDNLTHHVNDLHYTGIGRVEFFLEDSNIVVSLISFTIDFDN